MSAETVVFAGQTIVGAVTSFKVTEKEQVAVLLAASVAVKVTVCTLLWPLIEVVLTGLWLSVMLPEAVQLSIFEAKT